MQNTLYTNDNLFILNGLNSNSVDLIYLDPPFNSKRIYSAPIGSKAAGTSFKDMWQWSDINDAYLDTLIQKYPTLVEYIKSIQTLHSKAMMAYVLYMAQRIIEMHRILKDTGSFYLHCDPTASHYLKVTLDNIFGKDNFRNEIVWQRNQNAGKGSQHEAKKFGANTDCILFYTKSNIYYFNKTSNTTSQEQLFVKFNKVDSKGQRYNTSTPLFRAKSMGARPNLCYTWRGFTNPYPSGWRLSKERLEEEYQKGNIVINSNKTIERRAYLKDYKGTPLDNNWSDIPRLTHNSKEYTGYATQKPLALLTRIIQASSKIGDIVLDPFCGCATTCVAAQQLQRKWIGIDIEQKAVDLLIERLSQDEGMFKDFVHTTNIPQRTDVKKIAPTEKSVKEQLFTEQKGCCNGCTQNFNIFNLEVDHIIPKSKGGGDYYENYQLLCGSCNRIKGNRPMEYLRIKIKARQEILQKQLTFGE